MEQGDLGKKVQSRPYSPKAHRFFPLVLRAGFPLLTDLLEQLDFKLCRIYSNSNEKFPIACIELS